MPFIFIFYSEHLENTAPICQKIHHTIWKCYAKRTHKNKTWKL